MPAPGYYKTNVRAATFSELIRMRGWLRLPLTFFAARFLSRPTGGVWMPAPCADLDCKVDELSPRFWEATQAQRAAFERLGFAVGFYTRLRRNLNPMYLDDGGVTYVHSNHSHVGTLVFGRLQRRCAPVDGRVPVRVLRGSRGAWPLRSDDGSRSGRGSEENGSLRYPMLPAQSPAPKSPAMLGLAFVAVEVPFMVTWLLVTLLKQCPHCRHEWLSWPILSGAFPWYVATFSLKLFPRGLTIGQVKIGWGLFTACLIILVFALGYRTRKWRYVLAGGLLVASVLAVMSFLLIAA